MSVFDRMLGGLFGRGRALAFARRAELRGALARAVELYANANRLDEAARVLLLQGDADADPRDRLIYFTRAASMAPVGSEVQKAARRKRAELTVAMAGEKELAAVARLDILEAARELEAIGDQTRAAEIYARAGDIDGEARALGNAGEVDKLEFVLSMQETKERADRRKTETRADIEVLIASGNRRDALARLDALLRENAGDLATHQKVADLRARKAIPPIVRVVADGRKIVLVLGNEVVIGRTDGTLRVASNAVSRRHARIVRTSEGILFEDFGSRNGTHLRGLKIGGAIPIGDGLDLRLGGEVPLRLAPDVATGGVAIVLGGEEYVAPLGAARFSFATWTLNVSGDEWIELVTENDAAFAGDVALADRVTLLLGDRIARERGGASVLEIVG